tara:strand:- start:214439 stop:215398 length:960 start_codon:yes stop_codon:yes gene_type:complete
MAKTDQPKGAQRQRSTSQKLFAWFASHLDCAIDALRRMLAQPVGTLMTLAVIGIALLLPSLLYVAGKNLAQFGDSLTETSQITLFLAENVTDDDIEALEAQLPYFSTIRSVQHITPEQAAAEFAQWSGLGDIISSLETNPLPESFVIQPIDTSLATAQQLERSLRNLPGVESVQMDQAWMARLDSFISVVERLVLALVVILAMAVLFITGNSIRTIIASREAEIRVMTLIGATRGFITRPFLYMGLWFGLFGGMTAWLTLQLLLLILQGPASSFLAFYGDQYRFAGMDLPAVAALLAGSSLLGWLGAKLSVSRHLAQMN